MRPMMMLQLQQTYYRQLTSMPSIPFHFISTPSDMIGSDPRDKDKAR